jgi:amidohydrolase
MKLDAYSSGVNGLFVEKLSQYREIRRSIHANPELAFEEFDTAKLVTSHLERLGINVETGIGRTGVVGTIKRGTSNKAIGLRADMDALPMEEENTHGHRSRNPGKFHGCGHDGHTAMLLAAAEYLAQADTFDGTVHLIFQPAEESGWGGAAAMMEDGLFEKYPCETVWGMHNLSGLEEGSIAVRAGGMMASMDNFSIKIVGQGGHGGIPENAIDPVVTGAHLVTALQSIVSRNVPPDSAAVLSVTQFHAGTANNVIPNEVEMGGTIRTFDDGVRRMVSKRLKEITHSTAAVFGATAEVNIDQGYPVLVNSEAETAIAREVAKAVVGEANVELNFPLFAGSEDFAYMLQKKPGCYIFCGNGSSGGPNACGLHNPGYDFNDNIIPIGASYWVTLVEKVLPRGDR